MVALMDEDYVPPLWQREPLTDGEGVPLRCMHDGCFRYAVRIVSYEVPNHKQFKGQTHDCCSVHSRPTKKEREA